MYRLVVWLLECRIIGHACAVNSNCRGNSMAHENSAGSLRMHHIEKAFWVRDTYRKQNNDRTSHLLYSKILWNIRLKLLQNILASPLKFLWNGIFQRASPTCMMYQPNCFDMHPSFRFAKNKSIG